MRVRSPHMLALATALLGGCLIDTDLWESRRAELLAADARDTGADSGTLPDDARDADGDGSPAGTDCDDDDPTRHPGADEVCDGVDQDCDGTLDDAPIDGVDAWADADGDGQGAGNRTTACLPAAGWAADEGDCDDSDPSVYTGAPERLDGRSNDCANPGPDELLASDADLLFVGEAPGDGFGAVLVAVPDLDGDGSAELLAGASGTGLVYLLDVAAEAAALGAEGGSPSATPPPAVAGSPTRGDWDGVTTPWAGVGPDGVPTLLLPRSGDVEVLGLGGRDFEYYTAWPVRAASLVAVEGADGLPRAVVGTRDGVLHVLDTTWTFAEGRTLSDLGGGGAGGEVIVGAAGDIDDDGAEDLLVGLPASDRVWLLPLDATATPDALASFVGANERAGAAVGGVGDLDGDGWGDLAIGAPANDARAIDAGRLYLPRGPFRGTVNLDSVGMVIEGRGGRDGFGEQWTSGLVGDGKVALLLGNPMGNSNGYEDGGGVYIRMDVVSDVSTIGDDAGVIFAGQDGEHVGLALVLAPFLTATPDLAFSSECGASRCIRVFKGYW